MQTLTEFHVDAAHLFEAGRARNLVEVHQDKAHAALAQVLGGDERTKDMNMRMGERKIL